MGYNTAVKVTLQRAASASVFRSVGCGILLLIGGAVSAQREYLAGYLIIPTGGKVERSYNDGFSMYVAAWPLLRDYPGHRFQTGLPGTWMFSQYDGDAPKDMYSDIEGGLGWWRDTRFPTETPKFIMGGVGPNFSEIANGPSHGRGTWEKPKGLYGVAQLSPRLLFPIDGLNLKQGTCGELFGYGYLNLPLAEPKSITLGKNVPTGGNCWTLFLGTNNFKGPVAFFLPHFWAKAGVSEPRFVGQLLDTRPSDPNRHVQMETQYIPCRQAVDSTGVSYARIAPTSFPRNHLGDSVLVHQDTVYDRTALRDSVADWFKGGPPSLGKVNPKGGFIRPFPGTGYATWEIHTPEEGHKERKVTLDWTAFASPIAVGANTYGYRWNYDHATKTGSSAGSLVTLPEFYRLERDSVKNTEKWKPISAEKVPPETGLHKLTWPRPTEPVPEAYATPLDIKSDWNKPGPAAGPFKAYLGDGSVVTYCWYRFADQPAMLNAGLSLAEREKMQTKVEKLHRAWPINRDYLAPPKLGQLASLDPAQIVKPPKGLEVGYVPIATRQEMASR